MQSLCQYVAGRLAGMPECVCEYSLTRNIFFVLLLVGLSFNHLYNFSRATNYTQTNKHVSVIVKARLLSCQICTHAHLVLRLTLAVGLGPEDVKHNDENDGDGHDENG